MRPALRNLDTTPKYFFTSHKLDVHSVVFDTLRNSGTGGVGLGRLIFKYERAPGPEGTQKFAKFAKCSQIFTEVCKMCTETVQKFRRM